MRQFEVANKFRMLSIASFIFIGLASLYANAQSTSQINPSLEETVNQIINKVDPNLNIGIQITNLDTHKALYQRHINRKFIPASNLKLFTAAAALLYLGADYNFVNELFIEPNSITGNVLKGNVYLKLSGDPSLTQHQLEQLTYQLSANSIKKIEGDFILDTYANLDQPYGPGWMIEDTEFAYGAGLTPIMLDQNHISLLVKPDAYPYRHALIHIAPPASHYIPIANSLLTVGERHRCRIHYHMETGNMLHVSGCVPIKNNQVHERLAILDPLLYSKMIIADLLNQYDINLTGTIKRQPIPKSVESIATVRSQPLSKLTIDMLKDSNNLYADAIFLKLGAAYFNEPGNWQNSTKAVKEILKRKLKIDLGDSKIVDGSGLSRYNLLSPAQLIDLLENMYAKFPLMYEYIGSLPVAGRDGTLRRRLVDEAGKVRAKTGTMSGVVSLAGYLSTLNNQTVAFSIMMSGFTGPISRYQQLADDIVQAVINTPV